MLINIRKLAAVDMVLHGARLIVTEFAFGATVSLALGLILTCSAFSSPMLIAWEAILGLWVVGIGVNYLPLLTYSVLIARAGTVKKEGQPELGRVKRYNIQQIMVFVPLMVGVLALLQECRRSHG